MVVLGRDPARQRLIQLDDEDRRSGLYVIGKTGTGKTSFLVDLILQDASAGHGLCFLDPHGDAIRAILKRLPADRVQHVILLDPTDTEYPFGLNLFECRTPERTEVVGEVAEEVMHVFEKLWGYGAVQESWGPQLADLLRNCAVTFASNPGTTLAELPAFLRDETLRASMLQNVRIPDVVDFWKYEYDPLSPHDQREFRRSTLNKVREFLTQDMVRLIVGQERTTIDFRAVMDEGKMLLVRLPGRMEGATTLLGAIIIGQLLHAALSRGDIREESRRPFFLYADEYQRFATPDFATLLAEARKYAVATTIAHQFREQLDPKNRGSTVNAANMVVFQVTPRDAGELAGAFDNTPPPPEIVGQDSEYAITREPVQQLCRGHEHPEVNAFVTHSLLVLVHASGEHVRTTWETGLVDIAQYPDAPPISSYERAQYPEMRYGEKWYNYDPEDVRDALLELNVLLYEAMAQGRVQPISEDLLYHVAPALGFSSVLRSVQSRSDAGALLDAEEYEAIRERVLERETRRYTDSERHTLSAEWARLAGFHRGLRRVMGELAKEPIKAPSGRLLPRYGPQRTYADMEEQIANDLVGLPPRTALVRLRTRSGGAEHRMTTLPLTGPLEDEAYEKRVTAIRERTRKQYCQPRAVVEEGIAARRERLRSRVNEPVPTAKPAWPARSGEE